MPEPTGRQYRPGDVANNHILTVDGNWEELPHGDTRRMDYLPAAPIGAGPPLVPNTAQPRKSHRVRNAILIVLAVLTAMVACSVAVAGQAGNDLDDLERATQAPSFGTDPATPEAPAAAPAPEEPAEPGIGVPVRDGKFEFVVTGVEPPVPTIGGEFGQATAAGEFVVVRINVTNIGDESQMLSAGNQSAFGGGAEYDTTTAALSYLEGADKAFLTDLNPGISLTDVPLVFDVPAGTVLDRIELHDSAYSGGVSVRLAP